MSGLDVCSEPQDLGGVKTSLTSPFSTIELLEMLENIDRVSEAEKYYVWDI